jgi:hypothetical protein
MESQGRVPPERGERLRELNLDVFTDDFVSAERGFKYADLYAMMGNGDVIAWLTPHAAIVGADGGGMHYWRQQEELCHLSFTVDGNTIFAVARSCVALSKICDVVFRLLAASVVHSVLLGKWNSNNGALFNAASLAYLMEHCQGLKALTLKRLEMDEDHCRVLGAYSRPYLEVVLEDCAMTRAGATALAEVLGRNQGPTKLDSCRIDTFLIAYGLRGNSRLKHLISLFSSYIEDRSREILAIADALREKKGLVEWHLRCDGLLVMNDETWDAICDYLKTRPTLEVLDLSMIYHDTATTPATTTSWVQVLLGMMEGNMSIHTMHLRRRYSEHELFRRSVVPCLVANRLRPRVRATQKTLLIRYRAKVLGRALLAVHTNANSFWMLLSGNAEVVFPSTTATTTAASLPTPAMAAASSNTAAAIPVTATRAASSTGASALDIVAIPSASQKRMAHP